MGFGALEGPWTQSPSDTEGRLYLRYARLCAKALQSGKQAHREVLLVSGPTAKEWGAGSHDPIPISGHAAAWPSQSSPCSGGDRVNSQMQTQLGRERVLRRRETFLSPRTPRS